MHIRKKKKVKKLKTDKVEGGSNPLQKRTFEENLGVESTLLTQKLLEADQLGRTQRTGSHDVSQ